MCRHPANTVSSARKFRGIGFNIVSQSLVGGQKLTGWEEFPAKKE
jgi:hypothetical protein